jgi:hypothetical protein
LSVPPAGTVLRLVGVSGNKLVGEQGLDSAGPDDADETISVLRELKEAGEPDLERRMSLLASNDLAVATGLLLQCPQPQASYGSEVLLVARGELQAVFERGGSDQCIGQPKAELSRHSAGSFGNSTINR